MRLLPLASLGIEGAETQVAVGLKWAHAEFLGQSQGLVVVASSLINVRGVATHSNLAQETVGIRLVAASCVGAGDLEELSG
jgi:hypothetical protein